MTDAHDIDLLREFARNQSEPAFAEIVRRHLNLVFSVALRVTGNAGDAQDVAQAVFIVLAQKAGGLGEQTVLTGWLYETARFTALKSVRTRARRAAREQEALMQSTPDDSHSENLWHQLEPLLEEAMARLGEKDRNLLALHFFENKSHAESAAALGIGEWAARKRATRAVEKLRAFFARRGIAVPAAALTLAISTHSVHAAPAALAKTVTAAAMTKGATVSTTTATLVKGALKVMTWTKMKTTIIVGVGFLLAAGTTGLAIHEHQAHQLPTGPLPETAWRNSGYATPEAALQTSLWAMSKGDMKAMQASYTPEMQDQFMATAGKGKSDRDLSALFIQIAGIIGTYQELYKDTSVADRVVIYFRSQRMLTNSVPLKKIGSEWKIDGNIVTTMPANDQH